jgi:hypothetical protein
MSTIIGVKLDETFTSAQLTSRGFTAGQVHQHYDGKIYKLYQYDTGAGSVAAAAGNVAYFYAPSGTSAGATTVVTSDLSDSAEVGAGVLQAAPADGEYCWVQVRGAATLTTALTAGADGDPLTPTGATDGTLDVTTAATDSICAVALDASAKIVMCDFPY